MQSGTYALILAEENGSRRLPVVVGMAEAQSIAIIMEHISPPRPLTHDLLTFIFSAFEIHLLEVNIYKYEEGVFYSELLFERDGKQSRIDSRTSDAIAIALRVKCSIYTDEKIMQECGVVLEDANLPDEETDGDDYDDDDLVDMEPEDIKDDKQLTAWLAMLEQEDLESRLEDSITDENYEYAKMYRDELRRRKADEETEQGETEQGETEQ
jgi:bifunctional DNase/RNase